MMSAADPREIVGTTLGERYQLREPIASGAVGSIYRARSVELEMTVVVKILHAELAESPAAVARFRDTAFLAAQVSHPNIVRVIDFEQPHGARPYLVMECVDGRSVADLLRDDGAQPAARVLPLMQQLSAALEELHAGGIAHGEVNSRNLLLHTGSDGNERLKLIDFGHADRFNPLRGPPASAAADLHAAAVLRHELSSARRPTLVGMRRPLVSPAPVRRVSRPDWLRGRIGLAIRGGDIDQVATLYLALATLLRDVGDRRAAEAELEEAVNLTTCGVGPAAAAAPDSLWQLLLLLSELQTVRGAPAVARANVAHAYRQADRASSMRGRSRAEKQARDMG